MHARLVHSGEAMKMHKDNMSRNFEEKAQELISMMYNITEAHLAHLQEKPLQRDRALAASALALHQTVKTFIAVARCMSEE